MNTNWETCLPTLSSNINSALLLETKIKNDQENENVKAIMNLIKKKKEEFVIFLHSKHNAVGKKTNPTTSKIHFKKPDTQPKDKQNGCLL